LSHHFLRQAYACFISLFSFRQPERYCFGGFSDFEELKVKEETGATIRCFPFDQPPGNKVCLMTGKPADEIAIFAKSY
jgi:hypothetical protein